MADTPSLEHVPMNYSWGDFAGNVGVAIIVATYLLLQLERLRSESPAFSIMNALGAALVLVSLLEKFNLSAFIMESFWVAISIAGWRKSQRRRHG